MSKFPHDTNDMDMTITPAAVIAPGETFGTVTDRISDIVLSPRTPRFWLIGAGISFLGAAMLFSTIAYLVLTGIGIWDEAMFVKSIRTGRHWGVGRPILPPMPWQSFSHMTDDDLRAIFAYLRTVKPIHNDVPDAVVAPPPSM